MRYYHINKKNKTNRETNEQKINKRKKKMVKIRTKSLKLI